MRILNPEFVNGTEMRQGIFKDLHADGKVDMAPCRTPGSSGVVSLRGKIFGKMSESDAIWRINTSEHKHLLISSCDVFLLVDLTSVPSLGTSAMTSYAYFIDICLGR